MKKMRNLLLGILLMLLSALMLASCAGGTENEQSGTAETGAQETDAPVVEPEGEVQLYWNLYGSSHITEEGLSDRKTSKDDGYYHLEFANRGRVVQLRFRDPKLVLQADRLQVMSFEFDEEHIVSRVVPVNEVTGGILYYNIYVESYENRHFIGNYSVSGGGTPVEFDFPKDGYLYNVSNYTTMLGGAESVLYGTDQVTIVAKTDGTPGWIYVVRRSPGIEVNHLHCLCTEDTKALMEGHACEEKRFQPWNDAETLPAGSGYYFLNTDVQLKSQVSLAENADVIICLNGHTIDGADGRRIFATFNPGSKLTITDCQPETGIVRGHGNTDQGGVVWIRYGELTLIAGTLDASDIETKNHSGAAVSVESKVKFTMYGGTVIGGTAPENVGAGTIYVGGGSEFTMYGGTVRDGKALTNSGGNISIKGTFTMKGGTISGGEAKTGGNMTVLNGGKVLMEGGLITGGTATPLYVDKKYSGGHGGNLSLSGEFKMTGGVIENGTAGANGNGGGNLSILANTAKITLSGGTIRNGKTPMSGGNLLIFYATAPGTGPSVTISGTTISGGSSGKEGGNIICSAGMLKMTGGQILNGRAVNGGGNVYYGGGTFTMTGGRIAGGKSEKSSGGNVVVAKKGVFKLNGGTVSDGEALTGSAGNIYVADGAELLISGGTVSGGKAKSGGSLSVVKGGVITMKDGTVTGGTAVPLQSGESFGGGHGGNMSISGAFTMTGGTVKDGVVLEHGIGGGNMTVYTSDADVQLLGGTVSGGDSASSGGNILTFSGTPGFILDGATVKDGKAGNRGGNLYLSAGSAEMKSGLVSGGHSGENGGNIYLVSNTELLLSGGTIEGGIADKNAGNIRVDGIFKMSGGFITGGSVQGNANANDANLQMIRQNAKTSFVMTGGEISGSVAVNRLTPQEETPFITISGTAKITGTGTGVSYSASTTAGGFIIGALSEDASIRITPTAGTDAFATGEGLTDGMTGRILSTNADYQLFKDGTLLYWVSKDSRIQCECGCTNASTCTHRGHGHVCEMLQFAPYSASTTALPTSGNYYLTADVTTSATTLIPKSATLRLDLNGHTVTFTKRGFSSYNGDASTVLILSDSQGGGKYLVQNSGATQGNGIWIPNGKATLYGGTFDASSLPAVTQNGAVISLEGGASVFVMEGGSIIGGSAKRGGNVSVSGGCSFTMNGGSISGGHATEHGGNVYVAANGTIVMNGGSITGGACETGGGGNIRMDGAMRMSGGVISGGTAGGNVNADSANMQAIGQNANSAFTMTGGEIAGRIALRRLGASESAVYLSISGSARITDGALWLYQDITDVNFTIGALSENALIRIRPNGALTGAFATGANGFAEEMTEKIVSSDAAKTVSAVETEGVYKLSFVDANH